MYTSQKSSIEQIEKIGAISGIISIFFYFGAAVLPLPISTGRLLGFAFPLLWIISYMGLYRFLKRQNHTPTLEIAYLFGVIGASIAAAFIVVQQANFMWHDVAMETAKTEEIRQLYKASFRGSQQSTGRTGCILRYLYYYFMALVWI